MNRLVVYFVVVVIFATPTLASAASGQNVRVASASTIAGDFVQRLPVGTPVKLKLSTGQKMSGTLLGSTNDMVVIRLRTRIPEPPRTIALSSIVDADVERPSGTGKAIAIGAAAGAGAALGVLFILAAIWGD